jgi:hypothetical protein
MFVPSSSPYLERENQTDGGLGMKGDMHHGPKAPKANPICFYCSLAIDSLELINAIRVVIPAKFTLHHISAMDLQQQTVAKLVLLGEMGSGKSSLTLRWVKGQFYDFQARAIERLFQERRNVACLSYVKVMTHALLSRSPWCRHPRLAQRF